MSIRVPIREFKARLSYYLQQSRVQPVEITSHKRVVARVLGAAEPDQQGLARLISSGGASWDGGKPGGARITLSAHPRTVADLVLEGRD